VNFTVEKGEALGLIGPNGAGKTTLFNLISAALAPTKGTVTFKGKTITGIKPYKICRMGIARTFQTVKIFPDISVMQNVALGAFFGTGNGTSEAEAIHRSEEMLDFVGLADKKSHRAKDLTLSNQKRLEVARALATNPDLLLLDEIMAGLNQTEVVQAMDLINQIRAKGITIIMIEHVMRAIMNLCGRIMVLHHGSKIAEGTPEEVANSQTVIEVYFGEDANACR
jgi:branched-chain amino acid transport system ATP-binding protein